MYARSLLLLPVAVLAANYDVSIGAGGELVYSPNQVTAQPGDTLTFKWSSPYHSVSQSTFANPCQYMSGGVNSGIVQTTTGPSFVVTVKDTNPMWFYCSEAEHCQSGMVMAVNAPSSGNTYSAFQSAAQSASSGSQPGSVAGGTFGGAASASGGASSASSAGSSMSSASMSSASGMSSTMSSSAMSMSSAMSSASSMSAAMSGSSMSSAASAAATGGQSSTATSASTSPTKGAAVQYAGDAVAAIGAAALALLL